MRARVEHPFAWIKKTVWQIDVALSRLEEEHPASKPAVCSVQPQTCRVDAVSSVGQMRPTSAQRDEERGKAKETQIIRNQKYK